MSISPRLDGRIEHKRENWSFPVPTLTTVALWTFNVHAKSRFRLLSIGNYCGTVAAWGLIVWVFLADGQRQYPLEAVLDQIGYAAQRQTTTEIEFGGPRNLQVTAYNGSAVDPVNCGISLEWELIYQE